MHIGGCALHGQDGFGAAPASRICSCFSASAQDGRFFFALGREMAERFSPSAQDGLAAFAFGLICFSIALWISLGGRMF